MAETRINWTADEVILVAAEVMANDWKGFEPGSGSAIRLSGLLRSAPFHASEIRGEKFRNPNGVARKSYDIATHHPDYTGTPTNGSKVDREVLARFLADPDLMRDQAAAIEAAISAGTTGDLTLIPEEDDVDEADAAAEGRLLLALHRRRERDPKLRARKIASVRKAHANLACEACGFDFAVIYGQRGEGYIEVHHVVPLHASGETTTRLQDLALLCSNCHRMIHRRRPWITPNELRALIVAESADLP